MTIFTLEATEIFDSGYHPLPLGDLDPRKFEHFVADLMAEEIKAGQHASQFDRASLLPEGSDEGRDVELLYRGVPIGIIQCKRYTENIGHELALKEIIKFLLFARLDSSRMPNADDFRYILATSHGVTNKTRELFDQWPESLAIYSSEFQQWIPDVCRAYKTFKDLDPTTEAPGIISTLTRIVPEFWGRDTLSKRARLQPNVMALHFKVPVMVLPGAAPRPPDPGETVFPNLALLESNALSLCIVQTAPPSVRQIQDDASRPETVVTLRDMLAPSDRAKAVLRQSLQGRVPLVLLPEYALGSGDWENVDALIRGWDGSLVLIAGFGATSGARIDAWRTAHRETVCRLCGDEDVADDLLYNGGWCWIKEGEKTTCLLFLKNYLEQRVETQFVDGRGRTTLRIRFKDLLLCPGICADLLCETGDDTFTSRVKWAVEASNAQLPVLVTGSILQHQPWSSYWSAALTRLTDGMSAHRDRVVVALANHAFDVPDKDESKDRWRSLSGVFCARACNPSFHVRQEALRTVQESGTLVGTVLRHSTPGVVMGRVEWPSYGPTIGRHLWAIGRRRPIAQDGRVLAAGETRDPMGYELARFLTRRPPEPECTAPLADGLNHLRSCLGCQRCFRAECLASTCLRGIDAEKNGVHLDPDALHTEDCHPELKRALETLAFLTTNCPDITWRIQDGEHGHLKWNTQSTNLLVWAYKGTWTDLKRRLQRWQNTSQEHPPLIVVADTTSGTVKQEHVIPNERGGDVSASPGNPSEITAARGYRKVFTYPLKDIHEAAIVKDPDEPLNILQDLDKLLRKGSES